MISKEEKIVIAAITALIGTYVVLSVVVTVTLVVIASRWFGI